MKILLISNMYPDKQHPGFGVFVKHTEQILVNEGFDVDKVVRYKKENPIIKIFDYINFYMKIILKGLFNKYDVFYVHFAAHPSIPVLFIKLFKRNTKLITNVHGTDIIPENKIHHFFQIFVKKILLKSNIIIAPSQYFKHIVANKYNISPKKIKVFPSGGISRKIFRPIKNTKEIYKHLDLNSSFSYFGFVGRIEYGKGWSTFLDSIFKLKNKGFLNDKKVIFVGYGDQLSSFYKKVDKLNLNDIIIHFKYMDQKDLRFVYNIIDFLCFPTERKGESLGLVGVEAMACGTPVIGSKIAGVQSYLKDEYNGLFFKPKNSDDLAEKIIKFYELNDLERLNMKKNSYSTSTKFEVQNIKGTLIDIFKYSVKYK